MSQNQPRYRPVSHLPQPAPIPEEEAERIGYEAAWDGRDWWPYPGQEEAWERGWNLAQEEIEAIYPSEDPKPGRSRA